jgi:hypothetical protein
MSGSSRKGWGFTGSCCGPVRGRESLEGPQPEQSHDSCTTWVVSRVFRTFDLGRAGPVSGSSCDGISHLPVLQQLDVQVSLARPGRANMPQPGGGEVEGQFPVRKRSYDAGASSDLTKNALEWIVGANAPPMLLWKGVVG